MTSSPATAPSQQRAEAHDVLIHIDVIWGGCTNVKVPVAICPRYEGMALAGPAKAFDRHLDSWLTRIIELGIIESGLGKLFPVNLQRSREAGKIKVDGLVMAGQGEPGSFAADDLRYLMSNVTVAIKSMGCHQLSTMLIGTLRNELSVGQAVHGFLEGILDGYERFRVIADAVNYHKELFQAEATGPLFISLVEADEEKAGGSSKNSSLPARSGRSRESSWRWPAETTSIRTRYPSRMPPMSTRMCPSPCSESPGA